MNIKSLLNYCKKNAAELPGTYADWKAVWRCYGLRTLKTGNPAWRYSQGNRKYWALSDTADWIDFKYVDEVISRWDHRGWYADAYNENTYRGGAARFGKGYLAGYHDKESGCYVFEVTSRGDFYPTDKTNTSRWDDNDALREAVKAGDDVARIAAEEAKESSIEGEAEFQIEQLKDEIEDTRERIRDLATSIRISPRPAPLVCQELRRSVKGYIAEIRAAQKQIKKYTEEPWTACPSW